MSETREVTNPLVKMLNQAGIFAMRLNSGKVKVKGGWMHLCPSGTADIIAFPKHKPITWVETKLEKGKQRPEQKTFQEVVESLGHRYVLARSINEGFDGVNR